jgi:hypothetical protein
LEALPNEGRGTGAIVKIIGDATKGSCNFFKDGGNVSGTAWNNGTSPWKFHSEGTCPASAASLRSSVSSSAGSNHIGDWLKASNFPSLD